MCLQYFKALTVPSSTWVQFDKNCQTLEILDDWEMARDKDDRLLLYLQVNGMLPSMI